MGSGTNLAKAYVQIMPSADGMKGMLEDIMGKETSGVGESVGTNLGNTIGGYLKAALLAIGIGDIIKQAIMGGADLEQSIGGIETLFNDSSDRIMAYAQDAWKTAGLSANAYMETATSFAASLLQGVAGDTEKAAEITDMAITDMSDNANKMGTDMEMIQNAYQGFAKQNYTMLDNLKLGYGGTKTEMERLLADAQELTGVEYNIDNLADVYNAIHVIQEDLGITGTTALEASETISGSFSSVKAAWDNLLADMTLGNDLYDDIENLTEAVMAAADNILPAISNLIGSAPDVILELLQKLGPPLIDAGMEMIANLANGLGEGLPGLINTALEVADLLVNSIIDNIDIIVEAGITLVGGLITGLLEAIPKLAEKVPVLVETILTTILELIPEIIEAGLNLFTSLVTDLPNIISGIVAIVPTVIDSLIDAICLLIPMMIETGIELLSSLTTNTPAILSAILEIVPVIIVSLMKAIASLAPMLVTAGFDLLTGLVKLQPEITLSVIGSVGSIINAIINTIISIGQEFPKIGKDLIDGLWSGIKSGWSNLVSSMKNMANSLVKDVKSTFGIHSPSTVFRDEVGKMLDLGLAEGITGNMNAVDDAMEELSNSAKKGFDADLAIEAQTYSNLSVQSGIAIQSGDNTAEIMGNILSYMQATLPQLANKQVVMDTGAVVGALVVPMDSALGDLVTKDKRGA